MKKIICLLLIFSFLFCGVCYAEQPRYEYLSNEEEKYVNDALDNSFKGSTHDTSVFEGEHTYLIEEMFLDNSIGFLDSDSMPNGWDVDRRGGILRYDGTRTCLMDGDSENVVSLSHSLLTHKKGDLVFESSMFMNYAKKDGFFYELTGEGKKVFHLETKGDFICYLNKDGELMELTKYNENISTPIKAIVHMDKKTVDFIINNELTQAIPFAEDAVCVDNILISTSKEGDMTVGVEFVHIYINYIVNERFLTSVIGKTPYDWKLNDDRIPDVGVAKMQSQRVDVNSYKLNSSSILEQPKLTKEFYTDAKKVTAEFYMLIPEYYNGIEARIMNNDKKIVSISSKGKNFVLNNDRIIYKNYKTNLWYRFKIVADFENNTADIYLNYNPVAEGVSISDGFNKIEFVTGTSKGAAAWIDDVCVYETIDRLTGYPEAPRTVEPTNDMNIGMLMYSMWREGFHFGWDRMSPYDERTPYMGYYTEGSAETADWETKWLAEHGVNYQIFPFCSVPRSESAPIKKPVRAQALIDGLFSGKYKMDFCIMWSNPSSETIRGLDDFKNNLLPYMTETYFKNPNYKTVDGKMIMYTYGDIATQLGGIENLKEAYRLIQETAKEIGYDGAYIITLSSPKTIEENYRNLGVLSYNYSWGDAADDGESVIAATKNLMENSSYKCFVPSICQGFNTTPWRVGSVGFMTPEEVDNMTRFVADNADKWKEMGNIGAKIVTLTCWNEWGEGHFFSPSKLYGFSYLNHIRNNFTDSGMLDEEQLPTEKSFVRMNVMYPLGRKALKLMQDQTSKEVNEDELVLLDKIDFSNPEDFKRLEIEKSVGDMKNEDGLLIAHSNGVDPSIFVNDVNIDAELARVVKITAAQENGATFTVFYQTDVDTNMGINGKRFTGSLANGSDLKTAVLVPADSKKLKGNITRLRIDPDDEVNGEFRVSTVEIWGNEVKDTGLNIDGAEYSNNTPIRMVNDTAYMSVYKYFYTSEQANIVWNNALRKLHIDFGDKSIDLYDGSEKYYVNGEEKHFPAPVFYDDGNVFVPVRAMFEELGYNVKWDEEKQIISLESPSYQGVLLKKDGFKQGIYTFDVDGYDENWIIGKEFKKHIVKDGALMLSPRRDPAIMRQENLSIKAEDYRYAVFRIKNNSNADMVRFYFTNDEIKSHSRDVGYYINVSRNDKDYKEYVVDLKSCRNYKGTIRSLRFDVTGNDGKVYIDSIVFTDSLDN